MVLVSFRIRRCFAIIPTGARLQNSQSLVHTTIRNIDSVDFSKNLYGPFQVAHLFVCCTQVEAQGLALVFGSAGSVQALIKPRYGELRHAPLTETITQEIATLQVARRPVTRRDHTQGSLKFFHRFFDQITLLISMPQIVMSFVFSVPSH